MRWGGVGAGLVVAAALVGCTSSTGDELLTGAVGPTVAPAVAATEAPAVVPTVTLTPIDPGPPPTLTVPPRTPGEVARVVVTRSGSGKAFRN